MTDKDKRDRMLKVIDSASQHARMVYFLYLGFITYCAVTVWGTKDSQLVLEGDWVNLPILNIQVPLDSFFIIAPIIAILLYGYFMMYLCRLSTLVDGYENYLGDEYDSKELFPWLINIAREKEGGISGFLQWLMIGFSLWLTLPITLVIFVWKFVKKHKDPEQQLLILLAFFSILIVIWFWNKFEKRKSEELIIFVLAPVLIYIYACLVFTIIPQINDGICKRANIEKTNEFLVNVPAKDFGQYWLNLDNVNLNGADLSGSYLMRTNFKNAKLKGTMLNQTNLQGANLEGSNLEEADLEGTNLSSFRLEKSDGSVVNINTNLIGANLKDANLKDANLKDANLLGVKVLIKEQLCEAGTLYQTILDQALMEKVEDTCKDKQKKDSYEEWLKEHSRRE